MIDPRLEEQAALQAVGWLENPAELDRASAQYPEVAEAVRGFAEVAALLAYDAPQHAPHPALRDRILRRLDAPRPAPSRGLASILPFPRAILPYALAACLMGLVLVQTALILKLKSRSVAYAGPTVPNPAHRDPLAGMQLADLAPQGNHGKAKVMVAWDPARCCGMVSLADMPQAPPGHDYQLWVLDPSKKTPVNAGVVPRGALSQHFIAGEVHVPGRPGFALSLEPTGGRPSPTGAILFAVAPSE
jgi:anti-sigma-K factor RskA